MSVDDKEDKLFGTQHTLISDTSLIPVLEHICHTANNLINSAVYTARQLFITKRKFYGKHDLKAELKHTTNFQFLHSQCAQATLEKVHGDFESFKALKYGKQTHQLNPQLPGYRGKGGMTSCAYPVQALTYFETTAYDDVTFQPYTS